MSRASVCAQPGMTSRPDAATAAAMSAASVASLRTKPLSSRITESFSRSRQAGAAQRGEALLQPGDLVAA